ncbi:MAG: hypothetical protein ACI9QL_002999 [Candidatus Omnitrophota bacterium]|jgi:uncharacterized protein (TIGR01777 family)
MATFIRSIELPVSAERAFAWHERSGAFTRLTPPWEKVRLLKSVGGIRDGAEVVVRVNALGPIGFTAVYRHVDYQQGRQFVDIQEKGPFRAWRHEHRFHASGSDRCILEDHITYSAPPLTGAIIEARLDRMFRYRHAITLADMAYEAAHGPVQPCRVLLSGASGLVGRALHARLTTRGHEVQLLSRRGEGLAWDPARGELAAHAMQNIDRVIHLAGEPIAQRWTSKAKRRIMDSRVRSSQLLVDAITQADHPIGYVAASGINFYGSSCPQSVNEDSPAGSGFLAEVCKAWEGAAEPLQAAGSPTTFLRTGVVLSARGGALAKMLPAFRAGLAGPLGTGQQHMSWIALDDLVDLFLQSIEDPAYQGPLNAVAPQPISNRAFTRSLGRQLKRPTGLPAPAGLLRMLLGEMADETLLADLPVEPDRLNALKHLWRLPDLASTLQLELG